MAVNVSFAGVTYSIPSVAGENGWATNLTAYLQALGASAATTTVQRQAIRTALTTPVNFTATDYAVAVNLTTPGAVSVVFPAGVTGILYSVIDAKGDAATNNITVTATGGQLINGSASFVINDNFGGIVAQFDGDGWKIQSDFVGLNPQFSSMRVNTLGVGLVKSSATGVFSSALLLDADVAAGAAIALSKLATGALPSAITVNSSNIVDDSIVNADINASAAIAYTKLALSNTIVNADINASAAIAYSKLALSNTILNADINASAAIALSKLATGALPTAITIASANIVDDSIMDVDVNASAAIALSKLATGALPTAITIASANIVDDSIMNADINSAAAIARTKLAVGTANHVIINTAGGVLSSEALLDRTRGGTGITSTATFPASGVIVTQDATETLLNKTVVSSTAAITGALAIPSGTVANRSGLTTVGMIRHNTDANEFEGYSNSVWQSIGGGLNEQPVKNYLRAYANAAVAPGTVSNLASTTANLVSLTAFYTGTDAGASAVTSSTNSDLRGTTNYLTTALTSNSTGTSFVQFPAFALEGADLGKPVMLNFDILGVTADGNWDVVVVRYNSSGVHQSIISVAGNASAATPPSAKLPTGTSKFNGFWVPDSITPSDLYAVRPRSLAGSVAVRFDTLFTGPQVLMQTGALTDPIITTGITVSGFGATPTVASVYSRIGQNAHIRTVVKVTAASGYGTQVFTLPAELTPDFTKIPAQEGGFGTNNAWVGEASIVNTATGTLWKGRVLLNTSRQMTPYGPNGQGDWNATVPVALSANMSVTLDVIIPIVGWSSNVTAGDRSVSEYASNSDTTDADNTVAFAYGAMGSSLPVALTAKRRKRLQFTTVIQPTDVFLITVARAQSGPWIPAIGAGLPGFFTIELVVGTAGMGLESVTGSNTQLTMAFEQRPQVGASWSTSAGFYRVEKVSGGQVVGFPIGSPNIVGRTDGLAQPAGYVGEVKTGSALRSFVTNTAVTTGWALNGSVVECTIGSGLWLVSFSMDIEATSGTTSGLRVGVLTTDTTDGWGPTVNLSGGNLGWTATASSGGADSRANTTTVLVPAATSYNLRGKLFAANHSGFTGSYYFTVRAVRIA